jgi:putative copper export protein
VTNVAFGVVRALDYVTISLVVGGCAFLQLVVPDRLRSPELDRRAYWLIGSAAALGVIVSALGVLLEGAQDTGTSLWSSLHWHIVSATLHGHFGWVWALRAGLLAVTLVGAGLARRAPPRAWLVALCAYLVATPALAGHTSLPTPVWIFFPSYVLHVLAASVWVGGVTCLLVVLPLALRGVDASERSGVLAELLGRFSALALSSVIVLACTGVIQAYIDVRTLHALTTTIFGAYVLIKTGLLGLLIGLGAINRERVIPTLRRLAAQAAQPGGTAALLRRTSAAELALMACVFSVTAALVAYTPPIYS